MTTPTTSGKLSERKAELEGELQKVIEQVNQAQQRIAELQALAQRLTGAIAMLDELMKGE